MAKHKVVHFEIPSGDFKKSKEFYSKTFGWKMKTWGNEYMVAVTTDFNAKTQKPTEMGGINGGFYVRKNKSQQPSFVVETDSIEKTLVKVIKAGGKIKRPKSLVGDMGFMAEFMDPDGNEISLWEEVKNNKNMKGYASNIEQESINNENFRKVLYTGKTSQLVLMSLKPGEDIGAEVHDLDQFLRCESGEGKAILDGVEYAVTDGFAMIVPSGANHNIVNTSTDKPLKLYTIYSPPNHIDGLIQKTKEEAMADDEHYDGKTTE